MIDKSRTIELSTLLQYIFIDMNVGYTLNPRCEIVHFMNYLTSIMRKIVYIKQMIVLNE